MKGLIFRTFIDMVENVFSLQCAEDMIAATPTLTNGAYCNVGDYNYHELLNMVGYLSQQTGTPAADLVYLLGSHLLTHFNKHHAEYFLRHSDTFGFLATLENKIHVGVRKIHQNAEVPTFDYHLKDPNTLILTYESSRPFAALAHGLIDATITHYNDPIKVVRQDVLVEQGYKAIFTLTRANESSII